MATNSSLLGTYAPAMEEPYQIETTLAKDVAAGNPGVANMLLGQYGLERWLREGDYAQRLADQMAAGRQQMNQQAVLGLLEHGPQMFKSGGGPAVSALLQAMIPGLSSQGMDYWSNINDRLLNSEAFQKYSQGAEQGAQGGYYVDPRQLSDATGMSFSMGDPILTYNARIRAENAGGGSQGNVTGTTVPTPGGVSWHVVPPKGLFASGGMPAVENWANQRGVNTGPQQRPSPYSTNAPDTAPPPSAATPPGAAAPAGPNTPAAIVDPRTGAPLTYDLTLPPGRAAMQPRPDPSALTGPITNLEPAQTNVPTKPAGRGETPTAPTVQYPGPVMNNSPRRDIQDMIGAIRQNLSKAPPDVQREVGNFAIVQHPDGTYHLWTQSGKDRGPIPVGKR